MLLIATALELLAEDKFLPKPQYEQKKCTAKFYQ
ncbi:hypothetical protein T03_13470 [Trichinella britovi]|uniref:Uncharacterized protein n=1 Tax=Trichinella britovi TaxID=45882 RepID=A0A0V1CFG3_TRIBR|nr:hypothetical protein T03_13470 [Trichinella britovi]